MSEQNHKQWKLAFFVLLFSAVAFTAILTAMNIDSFSRIQQMASASSHSDSKLASDATQISNLTASTKIAQAKGTPGVDQKSRIIEAYALEAYFCSKQPVQNQLFSDGHAKIEGPLIHAYIFCGTSDGKSGQSYEMVFNQITNEMQLYGQNVQ